MKSNLSRRTFLEGVCAAGATATAGASSAVTEPESAARPIRTAGRPAKFILRAYSNDEHYNGDCDFAYVEIDRARARQILDRMDLLHETYLQDRELFKMYFWDSVDFFRFPTFEDIESGEVPEDFEELLSDDLLDDRAWTVLEPEFEFPGRFIERTECGFLVVCEFGTADRPNQEIE